MPSHQLSRISNLCAKYSEANDKIAAFISSLADFNIIKVKKLGVASTLSLLVESHSQKLIFRFIRDCHEIDSFAILRSHNAMFRIFNLLGAGHLVEPAALIKTPAPLLQYTSDSEVSDTRQVMVTQCVSTKFYLFRHKNGDKEGLAPPAWADLISNADRIHAALAAYLTVQQDMLWTNLFVSADGDMKLFDFDNCWRRPFPFTATKPIFFSGGPLSYVRELDQSPVQLSSRAIELIDALSSTSSIELSRLWQITPEEAEITIEKAIRVKELGLSTAITQDLDYKDQYWDAPPWWCTLDPHKRKEMEIAMGWSYNTYYDQLNKSA